MGRRFVPCTRYIDRMVRLEDGSPVVLAAHQRDILDHILTPMEGRLPYATVVWSEPKKSGKTAIAAWVGSWVLNTQGPRAEVLVVANDLEQSIARVFSEMVRVQQAHPALKRRIRKATESVLLLDDGSSAKPVALDYSGEAGANPSLVLHDEAWGIASERARRLYDELTIPPTRPLGLRWVSSYAGYSGESVTLEDLYKRGLAGSPVDGLPDCRATAHLFMLWSHTPRMPWQTADYYARERQENRPRAFLRLHQNMWVTGAEGAWLPLGWEDRAVDRTVVERPPVERVRYRTFADNSAGSNDDMVMVVGHNEQGLRTIDAVASQDGKPPFDPTKAIAKFASLCRWYGVARVEGDTYGGQFFVAEYARAGLHYVVCPLSPSQLYEAAEVGFMRGDIRLPNHARLIEQFGALREKGGKITHAYGGHDDYANAAAGCLYLLAQDAAAIPLGDLLKGIRLSGQRVAAQGPMRGGIWSSRGGPRAASWFDRVQEDADAGGAHAGGKRRLPEW